MAEKLNGTSSNGPRCNCLGNSVLEHHTHYSQRTIQPKESRSCSRILVHLAFMVFLHFSLRGFWHIFLGGKRFVSAVGYEARATSLCRICGGSRIWRSLLANAGFGIGSENPQVQLQFFQFCHTSSTGSTFFAACEVNSGLYSQQQMLLIDSRQIRHHSISPSDFAPNSLICSLGFSPFSIRNF